MQDNAAKSYMYEIFFDTNSENGNIVSGCGWLAPHSAYLLGLENQIYGADG